MDWEEVQKGRGLIGETTKEDSIDDAMAEFCRMIRDWIIPKNQGMNWDVMRVEIWADSGRLIAFPASTSQSNRIDKAACQIVFDELRSEYEDIEDSGMDEAACETAAANLARTWLELFSTAVKSHGPGGVRFVIYTQDEESPIRELTI